MEHPVATRSHVEPTPRPLRTLSDYIEPRQLDSVASPTAAKVIELAASAGASLGVFGDSEVAERVGPQLTCLETNGLVVALHLLGQTEAAVTVLASHASADVDNNEHQPLAFLDRRELATFVEQLAIGEVTIPDPDDPHGMPIYEGPLVYAYTRLVPGEYVTITSAGDPFTAVVRPWEAKQRSWLVTFTKAVDAPTAEDAIEVADDGKGGGHWEAEELCRCGSYADSQDCECGHQAGTTAGT